MTRTCRGCGADIMTIRTSTGRVDVDPEPVWIRKDGEETFITVEGGILIGRQAGDADDDPTAEFMEAYMPHRGHCLNGGKKPRTRRRPSGYR